MKKLPDFNEFAPFNNLKKKMGISGTTTGTFIVGVLDGGITKNEVLQLEKGGIDIDYADIKEHEDGTILFKGRRVLLYIRDRHINLFNRIGFPKYHVAWCKTLKENADTGKGNKYVVSTKTTGIFDIRITNSGEGYTPEAAQLDVCRYCLTRLSYTGYSSSITRAKKKQIFNNFTLPDFFDMYPTSPLAAKPLPKHDSESAPTNNYPADWQAISTKARVAAGWKCDECSDDLSSGELQKYLHTHHKNGMKNDCSPSNLRVLCITCHAGCDQDHAHMTTSTAYKTYNDWKRTRL